MLSKFLLLPTRKKGHVWSGWQRVQDVKFVFRLYCTVNADVEVEDLAKRDSAISLVPHLGSLLQPISIISSFPVSSPPPSLVLLCCCRSNKPRQKKAISFFCEKKNPGEMLGRLTKMLLKSNVSSECCALVFSKKEEEEEKKVSNKGSNAFFSRTS